ncbi:class I SAM-dependent methyltransferase [Frigidibacter sp. RF13]|uniref:class I SAM-dependent methyltransferase n=1 Tax=Frigidibacter sp. RF13 TaxID=2997340 RepID=UPI0022718B2B|nr:class I SAM-dependent methyltransferase [Frigidibacter sp. RF13]MCY1126288.1 class I SAM-dependent methyltransferase [Frigidibacter sp. RF13]
MANEAFQLSDSAVTAYEDQKVKAMFGPLARATLAKIHVTEKDAILDLACGTGIVARTILEQVAPAKPIVGVDLNEGMVRKAREITQSDSSKFSWHVANAENLPFASGTFSLTICQQGMQYFPDEAAVLEEIRRVSAKNAKLVITVWAGASDFFLAMADSVGRHVDPGIGEKYLAPFSYRNIEQLPTTMKSAGFKNINVERIAVDRTMVNIHSSIKNEILGHPAGPKVLEAGQAVVDAIAADIIAACTEYRRGDDMIVPQLAYLCTASAG